MKLKQLLTGAETDLVDHREKLSFNICTHNITIFCLHSTYYKFERYLELRRSFVSDLFDDSFVALYMPQYNSVTEVMRIAELRVMIFSPHKPNAQRSFQVERLNISMDRECSHTYCVQSFHLVKSREKRDFFSSGSVHCG